MTVFEKPAVAGLAPPLTKFAAVLVLGTFAALAAVFVPAAAQERASAAVLSAREAEAGIPHVPPPRRPGFDRAQAPVFRAIQLGEWARAYALAAQSGDPVLPKFVSWVRFSTRGERADFDEITDFIAAHPDWPLQRDMRVSSEDALNERVSGARVLAWFAKHPPLTPKGALYLAEALLRNGETARAHDLIRRAWIDHNFDQSSEKMFYSRFRGVLRVEDHEKRLDRLLWDGRSWEARRVQRRIKTGYAAVAEARMRLRAYSGSVDWAIRRVPKELTDDPGLNYERARWRRRKNRDDEAIAALKALPKELLRPALVWREQGILARRMLRKGEISAAYDLAKHHRQTSGESFADAEFLAGFIALRFLKEPKAALGHFNRLFDAVNYPVSKSRGAYWAGRAAESAGDKAAARQWYERGAAYITTFYGQLSAARVASDGGHAMPETPAISNGEAAAYARREVVHAARLAARSLDRDHLKVFIRQLVSLAKTPAEHAMAVAIAVDAGRTDVAVTAAKDSLKDGVHLISAGWPRAVPTINRRGVEPSAVLGLMRQESSFNPEAVSWAGARGLMQLMPATANTVAKRVGLPYSRERLLTDPGYNVAIGTAYFSEVLSDFSGSYVLALGAYNAGPGRVRRWLRDNGDFRRGEIDVIDWIEMVPVSETRDYIQRVLENVQVYRALSNGGRMHAQNPDQIRG